MILSLACSTNTLINWSNVLFFKNNLLSRKCLSKQTPLSAARLWLSWSLMPESQELKKQGAYQVNITRYVQDFCRAFTWSLNFNFSFMFLQGSALVYLKGPKFLIYVSGALSMWVRNLSFHNLFKEQKIREQK